MDIKIKNYLNGFLMVCAASFISMLVLFMATMWVHYQGIDYEYLTYALIRIGAISILSGILGFVVYKQRKIAQITFGVVVGPIVAAVVFLLEQPA